MPIAPPDLFEWVPTLSAVNLNLSFPRDFTADRIFCNTTEDEICDIFPFLATEFIFRSGIFSCGMCDERMRFISSIQAQTGHMILSPILSFDRWWVIVSSLTSRFCHSNVRETDVAVGNSGES